MGGDKYYKWKHRIDFYLNENGVTDLSNYRLGRPASSVGAEGSGVVDTGTLSPGWVVLNIEYWGYTTVPKPTYKALKELVKKPNLKKHMHENMLINKQDFILKIVFKAGKYDDAVVLYSKYKDYPYVWWVLVETGAFISDSDLRTHDSQLTLFKTMNLMTNRIVHIRCILTPKKDIDIDTKHFIKVKPPRAEPPT